VSDLSINVADGEPGRCLAVLPYRWLEADPNSSAWKQQEADSDEPLGSKEKHWLLDRDEHPWLLKYARPSGGSVSGEHWAECVVHALASLVGVPTACVRPALDSGRCAVVSKSVLRDGKDNAVPKESRLEHGSELLSRVIEEYDVTVGADNPRYTVANVRSAIENVRSPDAATGFMSGFAAWTGYVLLDAWVNGCDRHHDNWAVAADASGSKRLVESFDHGNALGFQVSEAQLAGLRDRGNVERWLDQGKTPFAGRPTPVSVALEALCLVAPDARNYWMGRLYDVHPENVEAITASVPSVFMSEARRRFVLAILDINRGRLLNATIC
jgi:hypothetical protein